GPRSVITSVTQPATVKQPPWPGDRTAGGWAYGVGAGPPGPGSAGPASSGPRGPNEGVGKHVRGPDGYGGATSSSPRSVGPGGGDGGGPGAGGGAGAGAATGSSGQGDGGSGGNADGTQGSGGVGDPTAGGGSASAGVPRGTRS